MSFYSFLFSVCDISRALPACPAGCPLPSPFQAPLQLYCFHRSGTLCVQRIRDLCREPGESAHVADAFADVDVLEFVFSADDLLVHIITIGAARHAKDLNHFSFLLLLIPSSSQLFQSPLHTQSPIWCCCQYIRRH